MDDDDERELGWEVDRALQAQLPLVTDALVVGFVNDLGQHIVRGLEPQPFAYRFRVIRDPRINAFAISGGYVYLHSEALLEAGSIDELAGLLGHEVAHVHKRHYARMRRRAQLPSLATTAATLAAAVAVQDPTVFVLGQAANVSLQLRYSRDLEGEADHFGIIFAARAGFDPERLSRFFERIVDARELPPYLYSHPGVEDRIATVRAEAARLAPVGEAPPELRAGLEPMRRRLRRLVQERRSEIVDAAGYDPAPGDAALSAAGRHEAAGDPEAALAALRDAEAAEPADPRLPFRRGELLAGLGRLDEAIAALRRTLALDPTRALVFHRLGLLYRDAGDRHRAVYAQEQALVRAAPSTQVRLRADWELRKLTFGVAEEATVVRDAGGLRFSARVTGRFLAHVDELEVAWRAPDGREARRVPATRDDRLHVSDRLPEALAAPGPWRAQLLLRGDVVAEAALPPAAQR